MQTVAGGRGSRADICPTYAGAGSRTWLCVHYDFPPVARLAHAFEPFGLPTIEILTASQEIHWGDVALIGHSQLALFES